MTKKITPEEYEQWLAENRPEIRALEPYVTAHTKIKHACDNGHEWPVAPTQIKTHGTGCPSCAGQRLLHPYDEWLGENRPEISALEPYINAKTKIGHRCEHGHEWEVAPSDIKSGSGCPHCSGRITQKYDEWLAENRPDITCDMGEYVNTQVKITHKCSHGHEWSVAPATIKSPKMHGCPHCSGHTPEPYDQWLAKNRPDMTVLEDYINANTRIMHRCGKHGVEWMARPSKIKGGESCPECKADATRAANKFAPDVWPKWLAENRPDITMIGEYKGMGKPTLHQCSEGHEWSTSPAHLKGSDTIKPTGCPTCSTRASDFDAVYIWEIIDALGPTGIYKVGLTSWKLDDWRIKQVARKGGIDYRLVALCQTSDGDARGFEDFIKGLGTPFTDVPDTFDGRTELRTFSPEAMDTIYQLLGVKEAQAEAA